MNNRTENAPLPTNKPQLKKRKFGLVFLLIIAIAFVSYFTYKKSQDSYVNHDYYRVLYEASKQFNNNLTKLVQSIDGKQSDSTIRSMLPSYKLLTKESHSREIKDTFEYHLKGNYINIMNRHDSDEEFKPYSQVNLTDLLPEITQGFSQLIIADSEGKVLQSSGGEKNISFADLSTISKEAIKQNKPINFSTKISTESKESTVERLPSYSSHYDMALSYGKFRIYFFPFKLNNPLKVEHEEGDKQVLSSLHLVALLPKHELQKLGTGQWNVPLVAVAFISLLTTLVVLRLYLLPKNQSITRFYRYLVQGSCYSFFFVIVAMLLAYLQLLSLQNEKDFDANVFIKTLTTDLNNDLENAFDELANYRDFYATLDASILKSKSDPSNLCTKIFTALVL